MKCRFKNVECFSEGRYVCRSRFNSYYFAQNENCFSFTVHHIANVDYLLLEMSVIKWGQNEEIRGTKLKSNLIIHSIL